MRRIRSSFALAAVAVAMLVASALPAAADDFGPTFFCDAQALTNCTDTSDPALAEDTFSCEGALRDVTGCTDRRTGASSPYCAFMGEETSNNRDAYMCGPPQDFSDQIVDRFWQQVEAAQQQVGYP